MQNKPSLRVMTLNVAHGGKDGLHQVFQSTLTTEANLENVAAVLRQIEPDIVALQEADSPSVWSGNLNHVQRLAEDSAFQYSVLGEHAQAPWLTNGTEILSNLPLGAPLDEIVQTLSQRENPLIVMGDFNCDWSTPDSALRRLARELRLNAYEPKSLEHVTYPPRNIRYDWILISDELEFKTYQVIMNRISDHLAVVSEIVFRKEVSNGTSRDS